MLSLSRPETLTVAVFDGLGRRVATLHMGPLAAGSHRLMFDAGALEPGTYVVRAATTAGVTSRLLVVR
jgi:hypothetical protein